MITKEIKKDEWAVTLDYLSHGRYSMERSQPLAQVMGDTYFSLLEVIVREGASLKVDERVYIGDGKRDKVKYIRGRMDFAELTAAAKDEVQPAVEKIVKENQQKFLEFFNKSGQLTTRMHQLELLPGIGKRHLWAIIDERKVKPFETFAELKSRVPLLPDPEKMVVKRILDELNDKDRYRAFVPRMESAKTNW
jgi:putative nucleotide binding protein